MNALGLCLIATLLAQGEPPAHTPTPDVPAATAHDTTAPAAAPTAPKPSGPMVVEAVETQEDEAHQIGKILRCPVCQGMPIAESPSQMAQDMMTAVRSMLAEGKNRQEILAYFTTKYGEWVLLKPKAEGMNLGLWILPILALLVGGVLVVRYAKTPPSTDAAAAADAAPAVADDSTEDEYIRAIRDEVNQ